MSDLADVAEVKEAIEKHDNHEPIYPDDLGMLVDAVRRWVRVVEGLDYEAAARVRQAALVERAQQKGIDGILPWDEITDDEYRELRLAEAKRDVDAALSLGTNLWEQVDHAERAEGLVAAVGVEKEEL